MSESPTLSPPSDPGSRVPPPAAPCTAPGAAAGPAHGPDFASVTGALLALAVLLAQVLLLALPSPSRAQAPMQSTLGATAQSRPQDRVQAALKAGDPKQALAIADQALQTFPTDAQLRFLRAVALTQLGRQDEAEAVFRGLTQEYPELPEPYNNLAFVLAAQGRLDEARVALEDAIAALPDYALARENLGDIHLQIAARQYREAARLDPKAGSVARKLQLITGSNLASPGSRP